MEHQCLHEQDFGKLIAIQTNIIKEFYGNGHEGMSKTIPRMQVQLASLTEAVAGQSTAISALAKAVTEINSVSVYREKEKLSSRQRTQIIITFILGIAGITTTVLLRVLS
jgi:hypothetical protein